MPVRRYFHGGVDGLQPGDQILPPAHSGHPLPPAVSPLYDPYSVYLAKSVWYALVFALPWLGQPPRAVYEVTPNEPVRPDPDSEGVICTSATVVRRAHDGISRAELRELVLWELRARRRFGGAPTPAQWRVAAEEFPPPGLDPRLLRAYATTVPGADFKPDAVSTAENFPELVEG